jgi:hypothetical protein
MQFCKPTLPAKDGTITPIGNGPRFFYTPSWSSKPEDLTPRSESSDSPIASSSSRSSAHSIPPAPSPQNLAEANFTVEEFDELDYELWDSGKTPIIGETNFTVEEFDEHEDELWQSGKPPIIGDENYTVEEFDELEYELWESGEGEVIRPDKYEDSENESGVAFVRDKERDNIDPHLLAGLRDLDCGDEEEMEAWLKARRASKARKWRFSSSRKRTLIQSIGSDTDDEDLQPVTFEGANEAGSSARRLRRKVGHRTSLIFDDPPLRIEEMAEESQSCEELDFKNLFTPSASGKSDFEEESPEIQFWNEMEERSSTSGSVSGRSSDSVERKKKPKFPEAESSQNRVESSPGHSQSSSMTESSVPEDATDWEEDSDVELCTPVVDMSGQVESTLFNVLDPMKKQMVERLMEEFWTIFNRNWPPGARQRPGNPTPDSRAGPSSTFKAQAKSHSGGNPRGEQSRGNRDDEDPDDGPRKRPRGNGKQPESMPTTNEIAPGFVCPYRKRNPRKYCVKEWRSCALNPQKTVARVK